MLPVEFSQGLWIDDGNQAIIQVITHPVVLKRRTNCNANIYEILKLKPFPDLKW